jgi:hypothetical protein
MSFSVFTLGFNHQLSQSLSLLGSMSISYIDEGDESTWFFFGDRLVAGQLTVLEGR